MKAPYAMSQKNVEIVRAFYEVWNAGDMDAVREFCDPDAILRPPEGWPEPGPYVGQEAVVRAWEQVRETWNADTVEPISDFIAAADRVVVRHTWRGAGHGPEANMEATGVATVRKGRIFGIELFWDHALFRCRDANYAAGQRRWASGRFSCPEQDVRSDS